MCKTVQQQTHVRYSATTQQDSLRHDILDLTLLLTFSEQ